MLKLRMSNITKWKKKIVFTNELQKNSRRDDNNVERLGKNKKVTTSFCNLLGVLK